MGAIATNECDASKTYGAIRECTTEEDTVFAFDLRAECHERREQRDRDQQSAHEAETRRRAGGRKTIARWCAGSGSRSSRACRRRSARRRRPAGIRSDSPRAANSRKGSGTNRRARRTTSPAPARRSAAARPMISREKPLRALISDRAQQDGDQNDNRASSQCVPPVRRVYASRYFAAVFSITSGGQGRRGRLLVPVERFQIIAHELFVEGLLRAAGRVFVARPEAGGIGREDFIGQQQLSVMPAEFEFRIGEDDAARFGVGRRLAVDAQSEIAQQRGGLAADELRGGFERDVFVVARFGFGGRREDRLGQLVAFEQARRAAECRRSRRSSGSPSSRSRRRSRARRIRSAPCGSASPAWNGLRADRDKACSGAGKASTSAVMRWFGTMPRRRSNQKSDICVRTRPLPGMPWGRMQSKAEMRSVATIEQICHRRCRHRALCRWQRARCRAGRWW